MQSLGMRTHWRCRGNVVPLLCAVFSGRGRVVHGCECSDRAEMWEPLAIAA